MVHHISGISFFFSYHVLDFSFLFDACSDFLASALTALCLMGRIGRNPPVSKEVKLAHLRDRRQRSASCLVSFLRFPFADQHDLLPSKASSSSENRKNKLVLGAIFFK